MIQLPTGIQVEPGTVSTTKHDCIYPQSNATARPIRDELQGLVTNRNKASSFYLDTSEHESNPWWSEGEDHHQGIARTHKLRDGSIYFFLTHSETDEGDQGHLMQFRYAGPTDDNHIVQTNPLTVAPLQQNVLLTEEHPADLVFLQDVNNADAGYLFVTEEKTGHCVTIYYWQPATNLRRIGAIELAAPYNWPNYIFLDRVGDYYYLAIIATTVADNDNRNQTEKGWFYRAACNELFPGCVPGKLNPSAFKWYNPGMFDFKLTGYFPCQVKLIRDALQKWYLLAFRSDPDDKEDGTDYIDYREIEFDPFRLGNVQSIHIYFPAGDTSFASTGTHYVEKSGRLLVSSSYRWSKKEGPGDSAYVSRIDECPSM